MTVLCTVGETFQSLNLGKIIAYLNNNSKSSSKEQNRIRSNGNALFIYFQPKLPRLDREVRLMGIEEKGRQSIETHSQ